MDPVRKTGKPVVLIAEDDPDDQVLLKEAFGAFEDVCQIHFVEDGEELMEYLSHVGRYAEPVPPRPVLILLDLSMPRKNGWEALAEIKERPDIKDIPLIIWTTSMSEEDRIFCTGAGASGYVTKPCDFSDLEAAIRTILKAWLPKRGKLHG